MLYVVLEYRRVKLGSVVIMFFMEKLYKKGNYICFFIFVENKMLIVFYERIKFNYVDDFKIGFVVYFFEESL